MPPPSQNVSTTILLVKYEYAVRSFVLCLLTKEGYSVITAVDGIDATEKAGRYDGAIGLFPT
jgi:CheY-like chemotaxis protein